MDMQSLPPPSISSNGTGIRSRMSQLKKKHMSNDPRNFIAKVTGGELRRSHITAIGTAVAILLRFVTGFFTGPDRDANSMTAAEADASCIVVPKVRVIESQSTMRQGFVTI